MSVTHESTSAVCWRTERLPQFKNKILRQLLAILSIFSSLLLAPALLLFPLPLLFLLFLPKVLFNDVELKLGARSSRLLRERRLFVSCVENIMVGLQGSREKIVPLAEP